MRKPLLFLFAGFWLCVAMPLSAATSDDLTPVNAAGLRELLEAKKGRIVVLNFWATWCRPCLEEIPVLQSLTADDASVDLVPVSLDAAEGAETVGLFIQQWFPGFRSWLSQEPEMDALVSVVDGAWNEVLPTTYVIDRQGQVAARLQGGKSAAEFAAAIARARDISP